MLNARSAAIGLALVAGAAGCTNSTPDPVAESAPTTPASSFPSLPTTIESVTPSPKPSTTAPTRPTTTVPATRPTTTRPAGPPACVLPNIKVEVYKGGSAQGVQYADIFFTNVGTANCSITGFPGVSLWVDGAKVGPDAVPKKTTYATVVLAPGGRGLAKVSGGTTCGTAPVSDTMRVYPPNNTGFVDSNPGEVPMRACQLVVDPVISV